MARIRQFKPGFFTDDKVGRLSRDARLFFFGVLSEADDEGRLVDAPKRLAGVIYPFDEDVTPKKIERWINELVEQQMVLRYQHEGGRFLYVRKFKDHQKMSHPTPSTLPPPTSSSGRPPGVPPEKLRSGSGPPPEGFAPVFEGVFEGVFVVEGVGVSEGLVEGVPVNRSSSSLDGVGERTAEEEENDRGSWDGLLVARLVAKRRLGKLTDPPPEGIRRDRWMARTVENLATEEQGTPPATIAQHLATLPIEAVMDLFEPQSAPPAMPAPLYPAPTQMPEPAAQAAAEVVNGSLSEAREQLAVARTAP